MTATAHGYRERIRPREVHRAHHVARAGAAHDQRGVPVVHPVPDHARLVVAIDARLEDAAPDRLPQLLNGTVLYDRSGAHPLHPPYRGSATGARPLIESCVEPNPGRGLGARAKFGLRA